MAESPASERIAVRFKRVGDGYVFRAPQPRLFSRAPHYLVTESERRAIAARMRILGVRGLILTLLALAWLAWWTAALADVTGDAMKELGLALLAASLAAAGLLYLHQWRALRPLLAVLRRTDAQITWRERLETRAAARSFGNLAFSALISIILIVNAWSPPAPAAAGPVAWALVALGLFFLAQSLVLAAIKLRARWD
ncbi:MAG TPA: hypothetical protein VK438_04425 [Xanthobacteraceae bacterium]|nr:hypothetical protein [Xanthobacteraceae bacterium]